MAGVPLVIVIEGLDGAGKQTLADGLDAGLSATGRTVLRVGFPRYDALPWGPVVGEILTGELGDLSSSVYGTSSVFAADRREWWSAEGSRPCDVWIVDRYVASNVAYGAARLVQAGLDPASYRAWIDTLEFERCGLPVPDLQIFLDVDPELARQRMGNRESLDSFESSSALQDAAQAEYRHLASTSWRSPWTVVNPSDEATAEQVAADVLVRLEAIVAGRGAR